MSCNCNKPKCDGKCGISPSVLQINNPGDCTLFHRVEVPASMGDSKTNPPKNGDYRNVLLYYVADGTSWLFSSDGIPQKLVSGFTDYEDAINLPSINGVTLLRNKTGEELGLQDKLTAGDNIQISDQNVISATDTTYVPATDSVIGLVKPGDGLEVTADGTLDVVPEKVEYIFPKFWANQPSQDCCLIKGYGKNICIDSGLASNWTNIRAMFSDNEISHFDYFILSHYDADHAGNINNMISDGYIDSSTVVYLPVVPDRFSSVQTTEAAVKAALTSSNVTFSTPSEGQKLVINSDFDITFGNLDKAYMEDNYTNYNYTSMVCLVRHKDTISFYAGDAGTPTYTYLDSINFIKRTIELYKQGHHGIDLPANAKFVKEMSPRYAVECGGVADFGRGIYQSGETSLLVSLGTLIYPTYINDDYVTFISNGYTIYNDKGIIGSYSNYMPRIDLYVDADASSNTIQDGTSTYPFEDLNQALGYINGLAPSAVYIHCADGSYNIGTAETDNISFINGHNVTIYGNSEDASAVIISAVTIFSTNIIFNHVTLTTSNSEPAVRANSSQVSLVNCILTSDTKRYSAVIGTRGSNIYFNSTTVNNFTNAVTLYNDSHAIFDGITLTNVDKTIEVNNGSDQFVPIKVTTSGTNRNDINYHFSDFKKLFVCLEDKNNTIRQSVMIINNPTNALNYNTTVSSANSTEIYIDNIDVRLRNGNTIFLDIQTRVTITKADGSITTSDIQGTYIVKQVFGLFNI